MDRRDQEDELLLMKNEVRISRKAPRRKSKINPEVASENQIKESVAHLNDAEVVA